MQRRHAPLILAVALAALALPAGRWRVRAETAADTLHAAAVSGWFAITVR